MRRKIDHNRTMLDREVHWKEPWPFKRISEYCSRQGIGEGAVLRAKVLHVLNNAAGAALSTRNLQALITSRRGNVAHALGELESMGMVKRIETKAMNGRKAEQWELVTTLDPGV